MLFLCLAVLSSAAISLIMRLSKHQWLALGAVLAALLLLNI